MPTSAVANEACSLYVYILFSMKENEFSDGHFRAKRFYILRYLCTIKAKEGNEIPIPNSKY